jgi:hypothetical protein
VLDGAGNWTKLTPAVLAKLKTELEVGDWPAMAAYRAGVSPNSLQNWIVQGCSLVAVEPYAELVGMVVQVEAKISGKLMKVVMDAALGLGGDDEDPEQAKWLLMRRFHFLWAIDKDTGRCGGISLTEAVERELSKLDTNRREAARKIIAALPAEAKASARKDGFLL